MASYPKLTFHGKYNKKGIERSTDPYPMYVLAGITPYEFRSKINPLLLFSAPFQMELCLDYDFLVCQEIISFRRNSASNHNYLVCWEIISVCGSCVSVRMCSYQFLSVYISMCFGCAINACSSTDFHCRFGKVCHIYQPLFYLHFFTIRFL